MNRTTKALLFDLDGTVLPQDDRPTPTVIEAVRAASRLIPVAIASGRVQDDVCHYARLFGLSTPQVADNGATLLDPVTGRTINRHVLGRVEAERVIKSLQQVAMRVLACDAGRFIPDANDITDWAVTMVMAQFPTEVVAREWAYRLSSDSTSAYASVDNQGDWYLDCTAAGIDKGTGAGDFATHVGIELADLMVIGDGINDIPMFEAAGFSVAMENSPADLLDVADAVVPNIENDGAAAAIERYVLDRS
jgi:HAD superfamily hydrolase (TIGR01484 family)